MFGLGFSEIVIIVIIAILFLGPDKLPSTMVQVAKFFRSVKDTVGTVKESIEHEMHVTDIKQEAMAYKNQLLNASQQLEDMTSIPDAVIDDEKKEPAKAQELNKPKEEEVTFKKETKLTEPKEDKTDV